MMKDLMEAFEADFTGLDRDDWLSAIEDVAEEYGYYEPLGAGHSVAFIDAGPKLLVTFESFDDIVARSPARLPRAFEFAKTHGWSVLSIISHAQGWFRDDRVFGYFDRLVDDGFFEDFGEVLFYGSHRGGYAAAAFSVAAPGARLLALRPVATLDPGVTGFDPRYKADRRISFTDRYGYAPDMIDAANKAWVVYDPFDTLDSMQAALFTRPNVQKLHCMAMGNKIDSLLDQFGATVPLIEAAMAGTLTPQGFGKALRPRFQSPLYLRHLMALCEKTGHKSFAIAVCDAALELGPNPFFARKRDALLAEAAAKPVK